MRRLIPYIAASVMMMPPSIAVRAADEMSAKETLLAAISYNLARFIERGGEYAQGDGPLVLCVREGGTMASALSLVHRARVGKKGSLLLRLVKSQPLSFEGCDIAYVSDLDKWSGSISSYAKSGIVTISNAAGFLDAGGAIQLTQAGQKFVFSVNTDALDLAGKKLSSRVLKLATNVRGGR